MTNYNKRLDEILEQAYLDGASETMWQDDRHVEIFATAKQAITSLIKELVEEAKPKHIDNSVLPYGDTKYNRAIEDFEQNLLKELEEMK